MGLGLLRILAKDGDESEAHTCPLLRNTAANAGSFYIRVSANKKEETFEFE